MPKVHTLTLELLRHGPAVAQLLSPLTEYLALCGEHAPETVKLPIEHHGFLGVLRGLRYEDSEISREIQLEQAAGLMTEILGAVPGLLAELSARRAAGAEMVHLRLVMAGAELALLPFELADVPPGAPGTGQPLLLQNSLPICLTRQLRRVGQRTLDWPKRPRILFVAADPKEAGPVPHREHRKALLDRVKPWVGPERGGSEPVRQRPRRVGGAKVENECLVVLTKATFPDLEQLCREEYFTHVHILAHGAPYTRAGLQHFGIAFHDASDPEKIDVVDGRRLALALAPGPRGRDLEGDGDTVAPQVVTLASCDSAQQGSLIDGTGSVAHELHQADIPLVVASQFPLSASGSILVLETLYERLLWGRDPRRAMVDLRRQSCKSQQKDHDWASLVAYAAFPDQLESRLEHHRVELANAAAHNSLDWADHLIRAITADDLIEEDEWNEELGRVLARLDLAKERLEETLASGDGALGLLASIEKRQAHVHFLASRLPTPDSGEETAEAQLKHSRSALATALGYYERAFRTDLRHNWAIAQYLSLGEVLDRRSERASELWVMARMAAENDHGKATGRRRVWALSTLIELFVLAPLLPEAAGKPDDLEEALEQASYYARRLAESRDQHEIDVYTTRHQLLRYRAWFHHLKPELEPILQLVDEVVLLLPETSPETRFT